MAKWIKRTAVAQAASGGTAATLAFPTPAAGNYLVAFTVSPTVLSTPSGWTLLDSAVGGSGHYMWGKTASGSETGLTTNRTVADQAIQAVVYEFPAGTTLLASSDVSEHPNSGVAVPGLSGMSSSPKLLLHSVAYQGSSATAINLNSVAWADDTVTDQQVSAPGTSTRVSVALLIGYLEDTIVTSWAPVTYLDGSTGLVSNSERITAAFAVAAEPEPEEPTPLATPTVTITAENDPTTIGGTNGSIQGTVGSIDPAADRVELAIATGLGQTTGFVTVDADAPTPFTITGRTAGNYTVGVRAHPAS